MITTGYRLPFRFMHSDVETLSGQRVSIRIRTTVPDVGKLVYSTMRLFNQIANTGGLGGEHLAPWDTEFSLTAQPSKDSSDFLFHADPSHIADEAWLVLCHLLLTVHQKVTIKDVEVLVAGDTSPVIMMESGDSTYPHTYADLPFELDDLQPEGGSYSFFITLAFSLTPENEATLNRWLDTWVQSILHGGYAMAPIDPASDYVEPYGHGVDTYNTTIEWAVFKLRADPVAAIDALVNLLAYFHVRCQPLLTVEIG